MKTFKREISKWTIPQLKAALRTTFVYYAKERAALREALAVAELVVAMRKVLAGPPLPKQAQ